MIQKPETLAWQCHLDECAKCQNAINTRLTGTEIPQIFNICCETGKPKYKAFIISIEGQEYWDELEEPQ